jgi:hypothetical protein
MLGFSQLERKSRGAHTWWVFVAGDGPDEGLGTWRIGRRRRLPSRLHERKGE